MHPGHPSSSFSFTQSRIVYFCRDRCKTSLRGALSTKSFVPNGNLFRFVTVHFRMKLKCKKEIGIYIDSGKASFPQHNLETKSDCITRPSVVYPRHVASVRNFTWTRFALGQELFWRVAKQFCLVVHNSVSVFAAFVAACRHANVFVPFFEI